MPETAAETPAPPAHVPLVGCFDERPGYAVHRTAGAKNSLLTWTVSGGGRLRQGDVTVDAGPGDAVLLGASIGHDYGVAPDADGWGFWWVHVQLPTRWQDWLAPYQVGPRLYAVRGVPAGLRGRIEGIFARAHADARWSGHGTPPDPLPAGTRTARPTAATAPAARDLVLNGVEAVLALVTAAGREPAAVGDPLDPRVRRTVSLLRADPASPHTVASLAANAALSPSRFAHLFAAQTGRGPMEALRRARLEHAAQLLDATDLDVGRVARASGFASAFHFSRAFRDQFGMPPRDYRSR
jgi:AraC family transcriptional regulator, arabinose operon regulatory protein